MLEALYAKVLNTVNINGFAAAYNLGKEYLRIRGLLEKHLTEGQFDFIPIINEADFSGYYQNMEKEKAQRGYLISLATVCDISISFLKSLEMNLDKELAKQKIELKLKKEELEQKERENNHMQKLLSKSLEAIKEFPEYQRSKFVEGIKKSHREIEKNTNKETKSQNK